MGKKAKAKPMRVWVILNQTGAAFIAYGTLREAKSTSAYWNRNAVYSRYRVVEFVAVTPRKRQKGKK